MIMEKNNVKKEAINVLSEEMLSPFAVMNAINKNRKNPVIAELLEMYGISKKMDFSYLLGLYDYTDKNIFCKLKKITCKKNIAFCEYKQLRIRNAYYQLVPIKFTISDFFASMDAKKKLEAENERQAKELEKLFADAEREAAKRKQAKEEKAQKLAEALRLHLPDLPYEKILEIARKAA